MPTIRTKIFKDRPNRPAGDLPVSSSSMIELIDTPEKSLQFLQFNNACLFPLDVKFLARKMGIEIEYQDNLGEVSGVLQKKQDGKWLISVNSLHHLNRQRYTIAHEIAHYCRHKQLRERFEDQVFFRGGTVSVIEYQANEFASSLLMPKGEFQKKLREGVSDIEKLAAYFGVSTLALRIRAKNLGYSGHGL